MRKALSYIIIWNLFQLLIEINCQTSSFKPKLREFHTATLVDNKLYILEGQDLDVNPTEKEFFYLDVSAPFNTKNLPWQDLSSTSIVPTHNGAASAKGGANDNMLFLYGGVSNDEMALVYTFDPQSNEWSIPDVTGDNTIRKQNLLGIVNNNGKMYLWAGSIVGGVEVNDMLILNTINLSWEKGSLVNVPAPRYNYGAVLLPDNNIIYIGGYNEVNDMEVPLDVVHIYDTNNNEWSPKTTYGEISARDGFSTTLGLDNKRIIIFGGSANTEDFLIPPGEALYVLDLTNFTWYIPNTSGKTPNSRSRHQANLVGNYIVISFGKGYDQATESDILLLDISNNEDYIWTDNFDPSLSSGPSAASIPSSTSTTSIPSSTPIKSTISSATDAANNMQSSESSNNKSALIAGVVGSLFGVALLSFGGFFLYKRKSQKPTDALLIPGSDDYDQVEKAEQAERNKKHLINKYTYD